MSDDKRSQAARRDAEAARERLLATAHELQARLSPATIAGSVRDQIKRKGETIADDAVGAVRKRPVAASAAAAGVAALLGFGLFTRFRHKDGDAS